jgi:hypothetical protein
MARTPQPFAQGNVTKATKAVVRAGLTVHRVEIDPDGKIVVIIGKPAARPEIEDATALIE